jgi:nitrite reductase/ring-hydroxylating ferredoxin subunit
MSTSQPGARSDHDRGGDRPARSGRAHLAILDDGERSPPRHMREPPRHPHGWFAPLRSGDVRRDRPTSFSFMGHDLVAFRDARGEARVLDAHCPHFGAHLGHGGEVVDGCVRCPFHKLSFDGEGRCAGAAAHYEPSRVRHLRTRGWASRERFGMIFVWHGPDPSRPAWEMPLDALSWEGWTEPVTNAGIPMPGVQPMWVAENIADIAHLRTVHCWDLRDVVEPPQEHHDGCYRVVVDVTWRLGAMSRSPRARALGRYVNSPFRLEAKILNPGIVVAEATLTEAQGSLQIRNVVLVNPVGERDAHLRILVSVRRQLDAPWIRGAERLTGLRPEDLLARVMLAIGTDDFRSDAKIWRHRRHLVAPGVLKGDGPLVDFRRWTTRFWPDAHAPDDAAPDLG